MINLLNLNFCNFTRRINTFRSYYGSLFYSVKMESKEGFTLAHYDVVGFDLDHTLCKYRLGTLFSLIYENLATFLVERRGYSDELYQSYSSGIDFIQKGIILDKQRGNFLKLAADYTVERATHGTHPMTKEQIIEIYGNECVWNESTELPEGLCHLEAHKKPYYVFRDYFILSVALICARLIDTIDKEYGDQLPHYTIWSDVYDGLTRMYKRENFQDDPKSFFYSIKTNPEKFLVPCNQNFLNWLWNLKQNKKLFLLTSSNIDFADFIAKFCLGEDWKKYFDIIFTFARKPSFFTKRRPFLTLDGFMEGDMISSEDLKLGGIYSQGNWLDAQNCFERLIGKRKLNVLYVGDSVIEDVFAPSNYTKWKTVAVVEEMKAEGMSGISETHDAAADLVSQSWGSFFTTSDKERSTSIKTLWNEVITRHSQLAIPDLDSLSSLTIDTTLPFDQENNFAFFPAQPVHV